VPTLDSYSASFTDVDTLEVDAHEENPFPDAEDEGVFDSGYSRSMTSNKKRLDDFQAFQGGKVTFGGGKGMITGKGTIRTPTLDFENVYYVKELQQFNLFSISQICDKKNRVLFTDTECLVSNTKPLIRPYMLDFINLVENQLNKKVKAIRCDNGTEFKNALMIEFCGSKGIKREYSNARTPQQNGIAKRKNRTLIEAARTMLVDSKLPTMFWTEARDCTKEEHIAVQMESKARTTLLQSIPDDHVANFHYMDDAMDIWNAVKARFGGNAESKKMRKSMLKQEFLEFRIGKAEGLHKG
nr:ribonuclease H-like domain-containing protein [Tanacetum cinerariifolium]